MSPKVRPLSLFALGLALALGAAACATAVSLESRRVQREDVRVLPGRDGFVHPLTGVLYHTPQDWQQRPALSIKVGNTAPERPQSGLDRADLLYEELVEGGMTRFIAVYSTQDAARIGPVRSARASDPEIIAPIGGLFGYSGAAAHVLQIVRSSPHITDVGIDRATQAYRRDGGRRAPYNLYTSTGPLWSGRGGSPPEQQFSFLTSADDATMGGQETAGEVTMRFGNTQISYLYDAQTGRYNRYLGQSPHRVEGSAEGEMEELSFRNVLVQMVGVSRGSGVDQNGSSSTDVQVTGSGSAVLFRGGVALRGQWERTGNEPTRFVDASGEPLRLAPGTTMVALLPQGSPLSVR